MIFELPKHAIKAFMAVSSDNKIDLGYNVFTLMTYMESFTIPHFVENGEYLFRSYLELKKNKFDSDAPYLEIIEAKKALLEDLFKNGFVIQYGVADRLVVEVNATGDYTIREESVGRMRDWCWIDQGSKKLFLRGMCWPVHDYICDFINKQVSQKDLTKFIENTY